MIHSTTCPPEAIGLSLRVPAEARYLAAVRTFVGGATRQLGLDGGLTWDVTQAVSEVAAGLVVGGAEGIDMTISAVAGEVTLLVATPVLWRDVDGFDRLDLLSALLPDGSVELGEDRLVIKVR